MRPTTTSVALFSSLKRTFRPRLALCTRPVQGSAEFFTRTRSFQVESTLTFYRSLFQHTLMKFDESVETSTGCTSQRSSSISPSMGKGNFFAFFSFPVDPVLDSAELQKRYHTLQRQFHPDQRHSTNFTAKEQSSNVENDFSSLSTEETDSISKYANEGYSILKDPFLRCRYLLKLLRAREAKLGGALSYQEEEALAVERENPVRDGCIEDLDEEFLMTMMAMNELIFAGDREQEMVRNQMIILKADLMERNEEQYGIVQQCWKNNDIKGLEACIHRWTYTWNAWNNLINRLP